MTPAERKRYAQQARRLARRYAQQQARRLASHMTRAQRERLATEYRALALEIADGRVPTLNPRDWCGCAIAVGLKRAGLAPRARLALMNEAIAIDQLQRCDLGIGLVSRATHLEMIGIWPLEPRVPGALVFPLLDLADRLEAV